MYKNILVPVDLNEQGFADKAVELAVQYAKHENAQIHLLNVLPGIHMSMVANYFPKDATHKMKIDMKQKLKEFASTHVSNDIACKTYIAEGKPYKCILEYAQKVEAELIIMPSHKRSKVKKALLGSIANTVVQKSPINVLVVKPQG